MQKFLFRKMMSGFVYLLAILSMQQNFAQDQVSSNPVKMEVLEIKTLPTGRPSKINLWFPVANCPSLAANQQCLADFAETNQVIVLSHGSMGSALEYSWLGEGLAAAGYIVVGVNHFGESWAYGRETQDVRNIANIWQRSQDISAILDDLGSRSIFQRKINWTQVVAIGHSAGGQTAAMLAGATFDLTSIAAYCRSTESAGDLSCGYSKASAKASDAFLKMFSSSQKDTRIIKIILLDPALGAAVNIESLHHIQLPALVIGATNNDFLPWKNHGLRYATEIAGVKLYALTGQEGHFIFLNECDHNADVLGVSLCKDRPGAVRKLTHEHLIPQMIEFIGKQPLAMEPPIATGLYHSEFIVWKPNNPQLGLAATILSNTPFWVFIILGTLVMFGLLQTRTRRTPLALALIMPLVMPCLSISGVIAFAGWQFSILSVWSLGAICSILIFAKRFNKKLATFDYISKKLLIRGSWLPLLVMVAIFSLRYYLGVATAMQLDLVKNFYFQLVVSFILGSASGFFLARALAFIHAKNT